MFFVCIYSHGPAWEDADSRQKVDAHIEYMHRRFEDGEVFAGGPFADESGGLAVLETDSQERAETIVADDPAVAAGVYTVQLRPWRASLKR